MLGVLHFSTTVKYLWLVHFTDRFASEGAGPGWFCHDANPQTLHKLCSLAYRGNQAFDCTNMSDIHSNGVTFTQLLWLSLEWCDSSPVKVPLVTFPWQDDCRKKKKEFKGNSQCSIFILQSFFSSPQRISNMFFRFLLRWLFEWISLPREPDFKSWHNEDVGLCFLHCLHDGSCLQHLWKNPLQSIHQKSWPNHKVINFYGISAVITGTAAKT